MAVLQRDPKPGADAAPLWLPRHDAVVVDQAASRPPDSVQGYDARSRIMATLLGSPWKMVTMCGTLAAVLLFFALVPTLVGAGILSLVKLAFYQAWTLAIMLLLTVRVRSIGIGTAARYWLAGTFLVAMLAWLINDPVAGLSERGVMWITPAIEELLKALPIAVAIFMGRRAWRHPGLSDLLILGFAVGAGYAFHEAGLWERVAASGFGLDSGLIVPSIMRTEGLLVVGQAVWASLIAFAIGLVVLHRRNPFALVGSLMTVLVVLGDRMTVNDGDGTLDVARELLFNGRLPALVFIAAIVAAVVLDERRLKATAARDHLFPSAHTHGPTPIDGVDDDPLASVLAARYRRLRNGVHTTVDATTQQWPPRSEAHPAPLAELARLGRAADVAVGPGTSPSGWASDPETPGGHRFVGPHGFTAYAVGEDIVPPAPVLVPVTGTDRAALENPDLDDAERAEIEALLEAEAEAAAAHAAAVGPTTASISIPKARPEARGNHRRQAPPNYWLAAGGCVVLVALIAVARFYTAGAASAVVLEMPFSLADAPNDPALIVGALGALASAASIRGRNPALLHEGWEVGPGPDPSPDRPDECEA